METMGQRFRAARERKKMNISKAAALTRIKVQHLEMMENDDFSKMPAPTYAKGFIRIYAQFLGLDPAPLVQEYLDRHLGTAGGEERASARTAPPRTPPRAARPAIPAESPVEEPAGEEADDTATVFSARARTRAPQIPPWRNWNIGAVARRFLLAVLPILPRLVMAGIAALLLVGIVRCTASMTSDSGEGKETPAEMDRSAIMKEPPVRYLELPATEEAQP